MHIDYSNIVIYNPVTTCLTESICSSFFMNTYSVLCIDTFACGKIVLSDGIEKINVSDTSQCTAIRVLSQELFVCDFRDGMLKIWNLLKKCSVQILESHTDEINCIENVPLYTNNNIICSGSDDSTLNIWNCQTGDRDLMQTLNGHKSSIFCCATFPDRRIISGPYHQRQAQIKFINSQT